MVKIGIRYIRARRRLGRWGAIAKGAARRRDATRRCVCVSWSRVQTTTYLDIKQEIRYRSQHARARLSRAASPPDLLHAQRTAAPPAQQSATASASAAAPGCHTIRIWPIEAIAIAFNDIPLLLKGPLKYSFVYLSLRVPLSRFDFWSLKTITPLRKLYLNSERSLNSVQPIKISTSR